MAEVEALSKALAFGVVGGKRFDAFCALTLTYKEVGSCGLCSKGSGGSVFSSLGVKGGGKKVSGWPGPDHFNGTEVHGMF